MQCGYEVQAFQAYPKLTQSVSPVSRPSGWSSRQKILLIFRAECVMYEFIVCSFSHAPPIVIKWSFESAFLAPRNHWHIESSLVVVSLRGRTRSTTINGQWMVTLHLNAHVHAICTIECLDARANTHVNISWAQTSTTRIRCGCGGGDVLEMDIFNEKRPTQTHFYCVFFSLFQLFWMVVDANQTETTDETVFVPFTLWVYMVVRLAYLI